MATRIISNDCFPLLELPDDVLANVLQRCPPGSIAGFPLPLALAQVRLTGSVDPHWVRPLLYLASKCPAVLDRLTPHLRSVEILRFQSPNPLLSIAPFLPRLERLSINQRVSAVIVAALPTCLTKLSVKGVDLEGTSLEHLSASLLRLTALEELDLNEFPLKMAGWTVGGSLPRLRRLRILGRPPSDLGTFAPNLEALDAGVKADDLGQLPITLTELGFVGFWNPEDSLLPLTRLTGLRELELPIYFDFAQAELSELFGSLEALSRVTMERGSTEDLTELVAALRSSPEGLGLRLPTINLESWIDSGSPDVEYLFRRLLDMDEYQAICDHLPWAALTRLTWLQLALDGSKDVGWIQPLSQLPSLRDLEARLRGRVPAGFGALTQCTKLELEEIESTANLSCLQRMTRLRECQLSDSPIECLAALPDFLTHLHAWSLEKSPDLPLGAALRHLTALENLNIWWPEGEGRVCDLSPLKRLTRLTLIGVPCPLVRLGSLPCLGSLILDRCPEMEGALLQQLGERAPSLRELRLQDPTRPFLITDADMDALTLRLSLLEVLELRAGPDISPKIIGRILDHLPLLNRLIARGIHPDLLQDPAWAELKQQAGDRLLLPI